MSEPSPTHGLPAWLASVIVALLALQLGMSWLQGGLLQRQHRDLLGLREDIQTLSDNLDQGTWQENGGEGSLAPARKLHRHSRLRIQRVRFFQESQPQPSQTPVPSEEDQAKKEIEASREANRKAVAEARDVQSKLSIEENARKADEKAKIEAVQNTWQ